jgi:hypothetical protein
VLLMTLSAPQMESSLAVWVYWLFPLLDFATLISSTRA